jgi:hypothetical protein
MGSGPFTGITDATAWSTLPRRHSRESGNPLGSDAKVKMDSRFRGNDGVGVFRELWN